MVNIPRPRIFVSILLWIVFFCGVLMVWQAPPPLSSSSLLHSSSSSGASEDGNRGFLLQRTRNKQVPRTHVSNLAYLQPKAKKKTVSGKENAGPLKEKINSLRERTVSTKEKVDPSSSLPRARPYLKISFRNEEPATSKEEAALDNISAGDSLSRETPPPMSSPITYHRSRIKDATPKFSSLSSIASDDSRREERRLLVHQMKIESKVNPNKVTRENTQKDIRYSEQSYYDEPKNPTGMQPQNDDYSYGPRSDHEDEYYDEEYEDNGGNGSDGEKDGVGGEEGLLNDEYGDAEMMVDLGGRFNVTPPDASIVIYNRVPKCASSTMQTILRRLSKHLTFEHVSSLIYDHHQLSRDEQEKLLENLTTSLEAAPSHALSYDRHLYYTNFTGLGMNPPVYINIVRDPVERFISSFYYRRSEERLNRIQMHGRPVSPSLSWVNRTVEQCVLLNDPECSFVPGEEKELMLSYFCGHQKFCRIVGNRDAVQMAKQVVSREYSVVGLVEHMDLSLLLLETLVPRFMEGATEIYGNIRQREHMVVNINHKKPKVSVAIREELLRRMSDDIDFYYFLEQRLFEQRKHFLSKN